MEKKIEILVDGSNIAFFLRDERKNAKLSTLEFLIFYLENIKKTYGNKYQIITDASLKYRIDDNHELEEYYKRGKIIECPKGVKADDFIIEYANRYPDSTIIISNDCFKEYDTSNLMIIKFGLIFNDIVLKPNLLEILNNLSIKYSLREETIESI